MKTVKRPLFEFGCIVKDYDMRASNGKHIRKATLVRFSDGQEIRFTERIGKRQAIRQALDIVSPLHPTGECGNVCGQCGGVE